MRDSTERILAENPSSFRLARSLNERIAESRSASRSERYDYDEIESLLDEAIAAYNDIRFSMPERGQARSWLSFSINASSLFIGIAAFVVSILRR